MGATGDRGRARIKCLGEEPAIDLLSNPIRDRTVHASTTGPSRTLAVRLDVLGAVLLAASGAWFLVATGDGDRSVAPTAVLAVAAGGFVLARIAARLLAPAVPAALIVGAAVVAILLPGRVSGPLGYANANGTLFVLAAFAALFLWSTVPSRALATGALGIAVVFGVATLIVGSMAASALFALGPVVLVAARFGRARLAILFCGLAVLVALGTTVVLGLTYSGDQTAAGTALTERRLALWHDALEITERHPVTGAGFDRFEELSPVARSDRDARWAHNEWLQLGAEAGVVGLVLVGGLFAWGFVRLAVQPVSARHCIAAAGLAAVGVHASIDYVLHFVAIPLVAAVLVGAATYRAVRAGEMTRNDTSADPDQGAGERRSGATSR